MKKKTAAVVLLLLLAVLLTACGKTQTPFLSESERKTIEDSLFKSLSLENLSGDGNYSYLHVFWRNDTDYDLIDVTVGFPDSKAVRFPFLRKGSGAKSILSMDSAEQYPVGAEVPVSFSWTIGGYTYYTEQRSVPVGTDSAPVIRIRAGGEEIALQLNGDTPFSGSSQPDGVSVSQIRSLHYSCARTYDGAYSCSLTGDGDLPEGYDKGLYYKLLDEEGTVIEAGQVSRSSDGPLQFGYNTVDLEERAVYVLQLWESR